MSSLVDRFLGQLRSRGLAVSGPKDGDPVDRLYLTGPQKEKTPEIVAALKTFKPDLLKRFGRKPAGGLACGSPEADRLDAHEAEMMREDSTEGE